MRIVFSSDLHGRRQLYHDTLAYARACNAQCVIIGGDLLPTVLKLSPGAMKGGLSFDASLEAQLNFIQTFLAPFLNSIPGELPGARVLYIPGNHDWQVAMDKLETSAPSALCIHGAAHTLDGVTFAGYGCVIDSSFWVKDYVRRDTRGSGYVRSRYPLVSTVMGIVASEQGAYALARPSIEEELEQLTLGDPSKTVCVFHSPPHGTGIDTLHNGRPIGSMAITGFIHRHQPLVSLHGHIHEAPYMSGFYHTRIGPTLAINPGHHPRRLHAVFFDTDDPGESLTHRIFGKMPVTPGSFDRVADRFLRKVKGLFMKKVLMR